MKGAREAAMADQQELRGSNLEKDPTEWKTGGEPMTGAQASYLKTLSDRARTTVATGYSDPSTPTTARLPAVAAYAKRRFAPVSAIPTSATGPIRRPGQRSADRRPTS